VRLAVALSIAMVMAAPAYAQITTPCNASSINSLFSPCMNFLTNGSGNGTSPTAECCNSLKSLTSGGMNCLCLVVTGNVPFSIPINRTLAISLPRTCNMPRLPVQCKSMFSSIFILFFILFINEVKIMMSYFLPCSFSASGSPLPAPGNNNANMPKKLLC